MLPTTCKPRSSEPILWVKRLRDDIGTTALAILTRSTPSPDGTTWFIGDGLLQAISIMEEAIAPTRAKAGLRIAILISVEGREVCDGLYHRGSSAPGTQAKTAPFWAKTR